MSISVEAALREGLVAPRKKKSDEVPEPRPEAVEAAAPETFTPVRIWTAGPGMPQEDIYTGGLYGRLRPFRDGAYYCQTPEELEIARKALGPRFWTDNTDEDMTCSTCGWKCRNTRAFEAHLNNAHGRAQAI